MNPVLAGLMALAMILAACENEGRSDEARQTVVRYLTAVASRSDDAGWSILNAHTREYLDRDAYIALARAGEDAELVPEAIGLLYEDDGLYEFAVSFTEPVSAEDAALLALENEFGNGLACMPEPDLVELAVIIDPLTGPGIAVNEC
jgi:hypothetical protein